MILEYSLRGKIWRYEGFAGWHFVNVDKTNSKKIKQLTSGNRRGFGSVKVLATIDNSEWKTSIFPDSKSATYLLAVKASVRKEQNLKIGDTVKFKIKLLDY